jgi:hypothetical protein
MNVVSELNNLSEGWREMKRRIERDYPCSAFSVFVASTCLEARAKEVEELRDRIVQMTKDQLRPKD